MAAPIASLNYLLTSHVWRQDHNGFSHQDPGFIDHVVNKKAEIVRVYLPPDANRLLSVADHCLRSRNYVNVIVAGKQPALDFLSMDEAIAHCTRGIGIWDWASNDGAASPTSCSRAPATCRRWRRFGRAALLREHLPELKVRVVNVVDLMRLQPETEHPHGMSDAEFDALFTTDKPVIFAYHGYPWLIHRLTYRRNNHRNLHVRGYKEEGTTTTPFDMVMLNDMDRFHLVMDVIDRVPGLGERGPRRCASRWPTSGCGTAPTRASTARTRPTCATGPGRDNPVRLLVVNAGSTSLKLRVLDAADATVIERSLEVAQGRRVPRRDARRHAAGGRGGVTGSCTAATSSRSAVWIDDDVRAQARERSPTSRRCTSRARWRRSTRSPACGRPPASTPRSTRRWRRARRRTRCPPSGRGGGRFGFHGLSHAYAARRAAELVGGGVRTCGSCPATSAPGLAAVARGRSVDTTMGFTAARRARHGVAAGSVDPGLLLWLAEHRGVPVAELSDALEHRSGLTGLAGTGDMRELLERDDVDAQLALDVYLHRLRAAIASMAAAMGGLDVLAFAGGVGEHAPAVRAAAAPAGWRSSASRSTSGATPRRPPTPTSGRTARPSGRSCSPPARTSRWPVR